MMRLPLRARSGHVLSIMSWSTAVALLLVTIALPLSVFYHGYLHRTGELRAQAELQSSLLSEIISANPLMWRYRSAEYQSFFRRGVADDAPSVITIRDSRGDVITTFALTGDGQLQAPFITHSQPLFDAGRIVGRIDVTRSLRPLIVRTAVVASLAAAVSILLFAALRVFLLHALKRAWRRLAFLTSHDALTGLPNRVLLTDRLDQLLARSRRNGEEGAVLCIDLDRFKDANAALGHKSGDSLLCSAASRLEDCVRESDTVARLGADEYAIVQAGGSAQPHGAEQLARRIIAALEQPFDVSGQEVRIGASIGIALFDGSADSGQLLRNADVALYRAQAEGRATYRFFEEEMDVRLQARKAMERELRAALADGALDVHYQPQVDLKSGRIVGVEALVRWYHPNHGMVPPDQFIGLAEQAGLISTLGESVLRTACSQAVRWHPLKLAVNLSPLQFRQPDLTATVESILRETNFEPHRLELEITERVLLDETEATLAALRALKALGVSIAMDDFGTGYSSLGYLRRFPFDKIKIDQSFVRDLGAWDQAIAIVRAVISLGRSLGIRTSAEGVESTDQAIRLLREGCEEGQGYLFGRPVPAEELQQLLNKHGLRPAPDKMTA